MKRPRHSVLGLMALIVLIALAFAALRSPTTLWASLTFTATLAVLATAVLGAIARRGRARMSWAGVAAFGWAYLLVSFGPVPNGNGVTCPPLPTQLIVEWLRQARESSIAAGFRATKSVTALATASGPEPEPIPLSRPLVPRVVAYGTVLQNLPPGDQMVQQDGLLKTLAPGHVYNVAPAVVPFAGAVFDWRDQRRIVHCLGAIAFGMIGAAVGRSLAGRDEPAIGSGANPS